MNYPVSISVSVYIIHCCCVLTVTLKHNVLLWYSNTRCPELKLKNKYCYYNYTLTGNHYGGRLHYYAEATFLQ